MINLRANGGSHVFSRDRSLFPACVTSRGHAQVPYGVAWYPYFMRRLAERPANVWFLARNLTRA